MYEGITTMEIFKLIGELGFPIAAACAAGYFVFLSLRFILEGVMGSVRGLTGIINALDNRVKTMNHDVIRIDTLMSNALNVKPDLDRIARADGKNDARRD
jgi:archaellum biogenesis ATPase FlaH